ncbi:tetratricopeptide repeat protein [Nodosilinea sp. E11]|uniref:tetratricopeptide repeat protein n=1 Tax=Nodosilinea sp. E11 TaxID=3037479 RepID=UPI002934BEEB|nr:tetratricopeptide repeat protein [Nodosilinea sp. E11]WOD41810.1 tetratricopeptide repeat protein [Nodosilinea sp. E11]
MGQASSWIVCAALALVSCQREMAVPWQRAPLSTAALEQLAYPPFLVDAQAASRYRQQGLAFRQQGDLERAIATLKIATALDPRHTEGQVLLGWTQHLAGYAAPATAALQTALTHNPDHVPALNALGIVYLVDGQLEAAVDTHRRAATLQPGNEIAHYNLSLAYQRLGQIEQAIAEAQTATELEPGNPHPWVALALAYWSGRDRSPEVGPETSLETSIDFRAEAIANYRQALSLDRRYTRRDYLDHLEQAGFSQEQIDQTEALRQAAGL